MTDDLKFSAKICGDKILSKFSRIITDNSGLTYIYLEPGGYYNSVNSLKILGNIIDNWLGEDVSTYKVNEILNHIKRETYRNVLLTEFHPYYISLDNGNFNLKTMKLEEHTPDKFVTYRIPVTYDTKVDTEPWVKYVESLVKGDNVLTLQEEVGNLFAPHYINKKLVYAYGPRDTGKSTWFQILQAFLTKANYSNLSLYQLGEKFTNADIYGKRANFYSETPYKLIMKHYGMIKSFTGGAKDTLTLQYKHRDAFQCTPTAKLFFSGNDIPKINKEQVDDAFYRRWQFHKFSNPFEADETIFAKYTTPIMKSAILKWALEGYVRLKENKWHFTNETSIEEAMRLFEGAVYKVDSFDKWLSINCRSSDSWELKDDLFRHCREWHEQQGLKTYPVNLPAFGKRMLKQRFIPIKDYNPLVDGEQVQAYRGIKLGKETNR